MQAYCISQNRFLNISFSCAVYKQYCQKWFNIEEILIDRGDILIDIENILIDSRDVACFQTKAIFINTTRKKQDARSTNKIQDCLIGTLELELDGEKL